MSNESAPKLIIRRSLTMSFEHAMQSDYEQTPRDQYQVLQHEVARIDDTINEIDTNLSSPYFYHGDREEVLESREIFQKRREEIIQKLATHTLFVTNAAA